MHTRTVLVFTALLVSSCGTSSATGPASRVVSFDMSVTVQASAEEYQCQFVKMPDDPGTLFVGGGSYATSPGVHHFLLFRTAPMTPPPQLGAPVDCFNTGGVMQYERGFVSGGQLPAGNASFPTGDALAFAPGEVLLFQVHLLNASASDLDAKVHVEMDLVDPASVVSRVGTFRFYDPYIDVPAHGTGTAQMRCHVHHDVTLLSAGSHMHHRGVAYRAYLDSSSDARAPAPFYTTTDWEHPPYWYGPMLAPAGSAIRFTCDYRNDDDVDAIQGPSADLNEMCMFSAFYVPEQDPSEDDCVSMDLHGTGSRSCAQTNSCLSACSPADEPRFGDGLADVGACWQKCIVESCPNVSAVLTAQLECTQKQCAGDCASFGATCSACIASRCKPELDACEALPCRD